jgi:hypothetical protein
MPLISVITCVGAQEADNMAAAAQRLNVFDNDEFDVMTQDQVDTSRIHKGKR